MFRLKLVPTHTAIPFMRWSRPAMALSLLLMLGSIVAAVAPGLNFGIDFRGGTLIEVRTPGPADLSAMRGALGGIGLGEVSLQEFGSERDVLVRIERQQGEPAAQERAVAQVREALGQAIGPGIEYRRVEFVGPKVSEDLIEAGVIAVALAALLMLAYIWFRFEWHFALGAIAALAHDVTVTIGLFAAAQLPFTLSTIAALLTIVGYSINDTVVVYDRLRENLRKYKTMAMPDLVDLSINETLSRTTMTSFTTLLALFALFIFGGSVIRDFVFAMIWGVVIGTYSSIFVATPLLLMLGLGKRHRPGRAGQDAGAATG